MAGRPPPRMDNNETDTDRETQRENGPLKQFERKIYLRTFMLIISTIKKVLTQWATLRSNLHKQKTTSKCKWRSFCCCCCCYPLNVPAPNWHFDWWQQQKLSGISTAPTLPFPCSLLLFHLSCCQINWLPRAAARSSFSNLCLVACGMFVNYLPQLF